VSIEQIDAQSLRSAFITGAKSLEAKKEWIKQRKANFTPIYRE